MLLAAAIDSGLDFNALQKGLGSVPGLSGVKMKVRNIKRGFFRASRLEVALPPQSEDRSLSSIKSIIDRAGVSDNVKKGAKKTFTLLAEAEAKVHGCGVEQVHFHEVGGLDAILDMIGWHIVLEMAGSPVCCYTRIVLGSGSVQSEHGEIPLPSPASLELLAGQKTVFSRRSEELVTPTAAAVIASCFHPLPADTEVISDNVGYGAGSRERKGGLPNVLRLVRGRIENKPSSVCVITSTIDDMNPEIYGFLMDKLLEMGALDVYYNSIMMKKNRPALEITVITEEHSVRAVSSFILSNTTTLGVRISREERQELPRKKMSVDTPYGRIIVKIAELPGGGTKMSPEYESCRAAAEKNHTGLLDVFEAARSAWTAKKTG